MKELQFAIYGLFIGALLAIAVAATTSLLTAQVLAKKKGKFVATDPLP